VTIDPRKADEIKFSVTFKCGTVWSDDGPPWTNQDAQIRHFAISRGGEVSRDELVEFFREMKADALRQAISRAQDNGAVIVDSKQVRVSPWLYHPVTVTAVTGA